MSHECFETGRLSNSSTNSNSSHSKSEEADEPKAKSPSQVSVVCLRGESPKAAESSTEASSVTPSMTHKREVCGWCFQRGMKLFTLRTGDASKAFCSELCFTQCRRASFKKSKICHWCKHVRHTVNYIDFQDGKNLLQFCSNKCLNQYKMNIVSRDKSLIAGQSSMPSLLQHTLLSKEELNNNGSLHTHVIPESSTITPPTIVRTPTADTLPVDLCVKITPSSPNKKSFNTVRNKAPKRHHSQDNPTTTISRIVKKLKDRRNSVDEDRKMTSCESVLSQTCHPNTIAGSQAALSVIEALKAYHQQQLEQLQFLQQCLDPARATSSNNTPNPNAAVMSEMVLRYFGNNPLAVANFLRSRSNFL